ncbi:hypothetical protein Tco_0730918 [Tanacetum coccineum]
MKKATEAKNAELSKELDSLCIQLSESSMCAISKSTMVIGHGPCVSRDENVLSSYGAEAADEKFTTALQALKDLEYPLVDQLERLKDAPIDLIMASLHLESDTGEDAPQFIRDLRPRSSQLKILVYPEEEDCRGRVVCRTHGVGSAHHARFDGVPVSVPIVAPQGLKILLAYAATQAKVSEDERSSRLLRSKSLPPMFNLKWS